MLTHKKSVKKQMWFAENFASIRLNNQNINEGQILDSRVALNGHRDNFLTNGEKDEKLLSFVLLLITDDVYAGAALIWRVFLSQK